MKDNKTQALVGAALLFVGVFMPIVRIPIMGSMNYFMNGQGDGVIVLLIAVVGGALALAGKVRHVVWPAGLALLIMAMTFYRFQTGMVRMREEMETSLRDNPFRGLADMAANSIQLEWGWGILLLGAGLMMYAGVSARRVSKPPEAP
jgi:hypothetical protein